MSKKRFFNYFDHLQKNEKITKTQLFWGAFGVLLFLALAIMLPNTLFKKQQFTKTHAAVPWPTSPPAQICGNSTYLNGPATPPSGAVTVNITDDLNALTATASAGTTFWLTPGIHTFTSSIVPKDGNTYIGAPGAIIDGGNTINIAFWEDFYGAKAKNVTLSYLTIQNFTSGGEDQGAVYAGDNWEVDHSTFKDNGYVALFTGPNNTIHYNCFDSNGQMGIGTYRFDNNTSNVIVDHNELTNNNTLNLQDCGCGGGMKWWTMKHGQFTNNWVHNNRGVGVWGDNNNIEILFDGNYIDDNDNAGLMYEISYNFMIRNNTFIRNALVEGAALNGNFPIAGVYISESGGINEPGYLYSTSEITNNYFQDNWDGVALWESGNRYAGTDGPQYAPAFGDPIHWKTQNVYVHGNEFHMDKAAAGCTGNPNCGRNGLFSDWVPVPGGDSSDPNTSNNQYQVAVTYDQNNLFDDNQYYGTWNFVGYDKDLLYDLTTWRNPKPNPTSSFTYYAPGSYGFAQDANSTFNVPSPTPTPLPHTAIITTSPSSQSVSVGSNFTVAVGIDGGGQTFNAAQATVSLSPNLTVTNIAAGDCNFSYTQTPTTSDPSFAGAILSGSANQCTAYTMTLHAVLAGTGTVTFSNGSVKAYADSSEIYSSATNGSYSLTTGPTATPTPTNTPTPTPTGVPTATPTPTGAPTPTPTSVPTPTPTTGARKAGDFNGDNVVDATDLSIFAVNWLRTTANLTNSYTDINGDGIVDLTDFSLFAKSYGQ